MLDIDAPAFVVHTQMGHERSVECGVKELGFEALCPIYPVVQVKGGKKITRLHPRFPRYIIVQFDPIADAARYPAINRVNGVSTVDKSFKGAILCLAGSRTPDCAGIPAPIPKWALQSILGYEEARRMAELAGPVPDKNPYKKGDKVKIINWPFAGFETAIDATDGLTRVSALLNLLGREVTTKINVSDIQPAA